MAVTYTRSHSVTNASIAANVASPRTIIPNASIIADLLPGALLVAEPPHQADQDRVLVSRRSPGVGR